MSTRPPTACKMPGCADPADEFGYCKFHRPTEELLARQRWWALQKPYQKLYWSAQWRGPNGLRLAVLRRDPICKMCNRRASEVADHIIDHRGDVKLFYDPKNVQGLCKPCHDIKTGEMHGRGDREPVKPHMTDGCIRDYGEEEARTGK